MSENSSDKNIKPLVFTRKNRRRYSVPDTAILSDTNNRWRRAVSQPVPNSTATLGDQRELLLVIRGMIVRMMVTDKFMITMGRFEAGGDASEIDLNPYGATDRGVSRQHAKIELKNNHLYVTDLGSTNGTYLAGERLVPNTATLLRKGDELLLGRLAVQILFR